MLRSALNWAWKSRWLTEPPPFIWLPQKPPPRDRYLTRPEASALLAACHAPHVRLFVLTALHTAARAQAVLDLTWERVDLARGIIDLSPAGRAQTRKGRAVVPMTGTLKIALSEARRVSVGPFVVELAGHRVGSVKKGIAAAAKRANLKGVSPHVLRHTAAVWMAEGGIPMPEIAQFLGHSDSRTTEKHYARYSPDYLRRAARAIEG